MKLKRISGNVRELDMTDGIKVLISYNIPVAAYHIDNHVLAVTKEKWSLSTNRQIQKYWNSLDCPSMVETEQENLNRLLENTPLYDAIGAWKDRGYQTFPVREINRQLKEVK